MARSRFDQVEPSSPGKAEFVTLTKKARHTNPNTIRYIDPDVDPEEAIAEVDLPQQTLYLIDKVVRQKAMQGPIGVDNSEVINLEMERELKRRHKNLVQQKADEEDSEDLNEEDRENLGNEKLLNRLYKAADLDNQQ